MLQIRLSIIRQIKKAITMKDTKENRGKRKLPEEFRVAMRNLQDSEVDTLLETLEQAEQELDSIAGNRDLDEEFVDVSAKITRTEFNLLKIAEQRNVI